MAICYGNNDNSADGYHKNQNPKFLKSNKFGGKFNGKSKVGAHTQITTPNKYNSLNNTCGNNNNNEVDYQTGEKQILNLGVSTGAIGFSGVVGNKNQPPGFTKKIQNNQKAVNLKIGVNNNNNNVNGTVFSSNSFANNWN